VFELRGVDAGYAGTRVLRAVSLTVPSGSVVALLGPNGAGKTTLLRTASGLVPTDAGRMLMDGVDVTGWKPHRLVGAGICHVPEGRGIFRNISVRENLVLAAPKSSPDEAVERGVDAFEKLGQRLGQTAGTMSGGEQ